MLSLPPTRKNGYMTYKGQREQTHQGLCSECDITWRLKNHHGSVDMDNGNGRNGSQLLAELLGLRCDHVAMLVRLT